MSRIEPLFSQEKAFLGYLTAGQPRFVESCLALVKGGVNLLEIGLPYTDPIADGPVIQQAMDRSLKRGTTPEDVLEMIRSIRAESAVPIVLFTYCNPIFQLGESFLKQLKEAGCDGILPVDLPLEEAKPLLEMVERIGLDPIFVATPSTPRARLSMIGEASKGFVYYACRKGTTGIKSQLPEEFADKMKEIKKAISLPVVAGFGIGSRETAKEVIAHADGFVVGSAFVQGVEKGMSPSDLTRIAQQIDPRKSS